MRHLPKLLLGAFGVAAIAGTALAADRVHVLNVALPDGSLRQVRYTGDVAPRVVLVPVAAVSPVAALFDGDSPFAMLDRMTAAMDAQANAMLRRAAVLSRGAPAGGTGVDAAALANGASSYSFTSFSSSAGGGCTRSVRMTAFSGQAPKVERQNSGDCSAVATRAPVPAAARPAAPAAAAPIVAARYRPAPAEPAPVPVI